jgi:hypothetical protein
MWLNRTLSFWDYFTPSRNSRSTLWITLGNGSSAYPFNHKISVSWGRGDFGLPARSVSAEAGRPK